MTGQQSSYRQIMKATSLFGGVQVFQIIISIIRSKFIAVLLGPAGMGIAGLLNSTLGFIAGLTEFGLGISSVKNIAAANGTGNYRKISIVITVLRRLVWITGLLGTIITLVFAPLLSQLTFGNKDYTLAFIWISVTLLFKQLSSGQMAILQGMRKLQYLAKANLSGSILGLIVTIPLYFYWGFDGIVPGIIGSSVVTLALSWFFANKIETEPVKVSKLRTIAEGKEMLTLGFMISLSGIITLGTSYILRIFISNKGGIDQVGLFNAGFAIINTYVGLVFTAMSTDYFPRLSSVASNNEKAKNVINQQAEIAILILAPIILIFLVFIKFVVVILYSNRFIGVNDMIHWAALGILFQAASWSISYLLLAKGASNLFFWNELIAATYMLGLNVLGYYLWNLTGLGIAFLITYIFYLGQMYLLTRIKYNFSFGRQFYMIFSIQMLLAVGCFSLVKFFGNTESYIGGTLFIIISAVYSYKELDKRLDVKSLFVSLRGKF